jgi:hypothetical protein
MSDTQRQPSDERLRFISARQTHSALHSHRVEIDWRICDTCFLFVYAEKEHVEAEKGRRLVRAALGERP